MATVSVAMLSVDDVVWLTVRKGCGCDGDGDDDDDVSHNQINSFIYYVTFLFIYSIIFFIYFLLMLLVFIFISLKGRVMMVNTCLWGG